MIASFAIAIGGGLLAGTVIFLSLVAAMAWHMRKPKEPQ